MWINKEYLDGTPSMLIFGGECPVLWLYITPIQRTGSSAPIFHRLVPYGPRSPTPEGVRRHDEESVDEY